MPSVANKPIILSVIMLSVIMLSVIMLSVIMLNVVAPIKWSKRSHWSFRTFRIQCRQKLELNFNLIKKI
jgi:hypothetical protein